MMLAPKRSRDATRERLLDAGRELILERGLPEQLDVKLTDVLAREGLTTGAAYNIWASQDEYRSELALHLARSFDWADARTVRKAIDSLRADSSIDDWVQIVADTYFPLFLQNQSFYLILHFWSVLEPSVELVAAIQQGYDTVHESFRELYEYTVESYGLAVTHPYTIDHVTTMITGALEGLALRHRFQPDKVSSPDVGLLFTSMLRMIAATYLRPID